LWVKREDCSSRRYGGNKVRCLEFLLAGAAADVVFVTVGGTGSTHCLATAAHARALGRRAVLAQFPQPETDAACAVARACAAQATVVRARSRIGLPLAVVRAWALASRRGQPRWIPGGGATPRGLIGHVLAALELATQLPGPPDAIVTPLGTGGTAAGLLLGIGALGWPTRVVGVGVAPTIVANRWRTARLARRARRLLARQGIPVPLPSSPVPVVLDGLGPGYGHPSEAGEAARRAAAAHGLILDPTYGAKAFAAVRSAVALRFRRVVFWDTFAWPPADLERAQ